MRKRIITVMLLSLTLCVFSQNNKKTEKENNVNKSGGIYNYVDENDAKTL